MWTTADYALIVSFGSAAISMLSLAWNIWSKFIVPRPKVVVRAAMMHLLDDEDVRFTDITATNLGPGDVTLSALVSKNGRTWRLWRRPRLALLVSISHPLKPGEFGLGADGLPKKLTPGERHTSYLVAPHQGLVGNDIATVGFSDTFGRMHWAPRKEVKRVRESARKLLELGEAAQDSPGGSQNWTAA